MAPKSKTTSVDELRTFFGFALIGLANTVLPSIIYAANYLTVPYPRPIVALIELLPSIAVKLSLPFVIQRVPCRMRPLVIAACWLIAKKVADDTPPNVLPPVRIATTVLASTLAAAMEVSCLGMVAHAGMLALVGWGSGTAAGLVANAAWPFFLTHRVGKVLRSATGSIYFLLILLVLAHFVVVPQRFTKRDAPPQHGRGRENEEERHGFLEAGQSRARSTSPKTFEAKKRLLRGLVRSDMLPLFAASAMLLLQQGIARTLDGSVFGTFSRFSATYGISLHLGTLVARSSIKVYPVRDLKTTFALLTTVAIFAFFNAVFLVSTYLAFLLAFLAGLSSGLVYINILARVMEGTRDHKDREFSLGTVTAGDVGGMAFGSLLGAFLETLMCGLLLSNRRWCHRAR